MGRLSRSIAEISDLLLTLCTHSIQLTNNTLSLQNLISERGISKILFDRLRKDHGDPNIHTYQNFLIDECEKTSLHVQTLFNTVGDPSPGTLAMKRNAVITLIDLIMRNTRLLAYATVAIITAIDPSQKTLQQNLFNTLIDLISSILVVFRQSKRVMITWEIILVANRRESIKNHAKKVALKVQNAKNSFHKSVKKAVGVSWGVPEVEILAISAEPDNLESSHSPQDVTIISNEESTQVETESEELTSFQQAIQLVTQLMNQYLDQLVKLEELDKNKAKREVHRVSFGSTSDFDQTEEEVLMGTDIIDSNEKDVCSVESISNAQETDKDEQDQQEENHKKSKKKLIGAVRVLPFNALESHLHLKSNHDGKKNWSIDRSHSSRSMIDLTSLSSKEQNSRNHHNRSISHPSLSSIGKDEATMTTPRLNINASSSLGPSKCMVDAATSPDLFIAPPRRVSLPPSYDSLARQIESLQNLHGLSLSTANLSQLIENHVQSVVNRTSSHKDGLGILSSSLTDLSKKELLHGPSTSEKKFSNASLTDMNSMISMVSDKKN